MQNNKKAIALVTVLISITILTIIAGVSLTLMTSQARLVESQVRRIKAMYTAEGLMWRAIDGLRINPNFNVDSLEGDPIVRNREDEQIAGNNMISADINYNSQSPLNNRSLAVQITY
ncbi:MAG: hypothetical protein AB1755_01115 [Candidatus Omnitrophota bacterium]